VHGARCAILLDAPAGYGKTWLGAGTRSCAVRVLSAWLGVEQPDAAQFLALPWRPARAGIDVGRLEVRRQGFGDAPLATIVSAGRPLVAAGTEVVVCRRPALVVA
jgi:hypothetical protein